MTPLRAPWSSAWLALRSTFWAIALPGIVAGYVPWRVFGLREARGDLLEAGQLTGILVAGLGAVLLVACIVEFARRGRGTLSPVDPPRRLVVRGLYRYVRNPMYVSVSAILLGEAMVAPSLGIWIYWLLWFTGVNLFVMAYEEPTLRRTFGAEYDAYCRQVGRWIPRWPR